MSVRRVVVVGGGITGLAAAYRLLREGAGRDGNPLEVTLIEERRRLGGNVQTERHDGFVVDGGPDSFITTKPQGTALCKELGLGDRLIGTSPENRRVYVRHHGELHPLPEGLMLTVPTRFLPLARSPLMSWPGKMRMALDLVLPRRARGEDESMGHFVRRRLGQEALDRLAEPLMGGIYAGDVEALSIDSTFPQLVDLERRHGSLIRGAIAQRAGAGARLVKPNAGAAPSAFHSLTGGMGELVDALRAAIEAAGGTVQTDTRLLALTRPRGGLLAPPSPRLLVRVATPSGAEETLPADDVVLALPAYACASALEGLDAELARPLREIPYLSTGTIVVAYPRAEIPHPLDALGLIFPRSEGRRILAATFISSKWTGRAPSGMALLRVFVGGHRDPTALGQSDEALVDLARTELRELLAIRAAPLFTRVFRFDRSNPQPLLGHGKRVRDLRARASRIPGLYLAGAAFDGVGIPDCIRQANEVASAILRA